MFEQMKSSVLHVSGYSIFIVSAAIYSYPSWGADATQFMSKERIYYEIAACVCLVIFTWVGLISLRYIQIFTDWSMKPNGDIEKYRSGLNTAMLLHSMLTIGVGSYAVVIFL